MVQNVASNSSIASVSGFNPLAGAEQYPSDRRVRGDVRTSGQKRRHLHGEQAQNALDRLDRYIIRDARVEQTASLAAIQIQAAPSLRAPASSRTIARRLAEGRLVSRCPLRVLLMIPTHRYLHLEWHDGIGL
ncbi:hypothetical protein TNCV_519181 [Trichonephila clavipes]|nr:hypothetical protein TNCV_519181 [Trichonephila clavipes]